MLRAARNSSAVCQASRPAYQRASFSRPFSPARSLQLCSHTWAEKSRCSLLSFSYPLVHSINNAAIHAAKYRPADALFEVAPAGRSGCRARRCFNVSPGVRRTHGYDNIKASRIREKSDVYPFEYSYRVSPFDVLSSGNLIATRVASDRFRVQRRSLGTFKRN